MPSGRPRLPGTEAERAAARRQQVRENVRAFRQRNRERISTSQASTSDPSPDTSRRSSSTGFESTAGPTTETQFASSQSSNQERHQMKLTGIPDGTSTRWSLCLPLIIDLGPAYANGFVAVSVDQSGPGQSSLELVTMTLPLPDREEMVASEEKTIPESFLDPGFVTTSDLTPSTNHDLVRMEVSCCKKWTTAVTLDALSTNSRILKEALLATCLSLVSMDKNDPRMSIDGMFVQGRVLRKLREGLDVFLQNGENMEKDEAALLAVTAMTMSVYELLVNQSWEGFVFHLRGVGALLKQSGLPSLETTTPHAEQCVFNGHGVDVNS